MRLTALDKAYPLSIRTFSVPDAIHAMGQAQCPAVAS